jgi:hypothetical protein|tara:strand:+ start:303 stop:512 length:210 start_codon:yes stop_codon:yes gene_type:complete
MALAAIIELFVDIVKTNQLKDAIANAKTEIIPFINTGALFSRATLENLAVIQIPIITDKMRVALGALAD